MTTQSVHFSSSRSLIKERKAHQNFEPEFHGTLFYENEIPSFLASEMDALYENIHSSASKFQIDRRAFNTTTYVHRHEGLITAILVFTQTERKIEVLNECIKLKENDIHDFASAVFSKYPNVSLITFNAIQASIEQLKYPYQCHTCLEDIVLELPVSSDLYLNSLGKSTRQYINRYGKVVKRDFPSFQFKIYRTGELTDAEIREIIGFSNARIAAKDHVSLHNEESTQRLIQLIQLHGFVGVILIDGRVCAGAICSKLGVHYFLHVLAHDPNFDNYRLGTICCYLTICESIADGGRMFHFLWGRFDYKFRLLGMQNDLQRLVVYRSYFQLFLNVPYASKVFVRGIGRMVKGWLSEPERKDWIISRIALKVDEGTRRLFSGSVTKRH